MIDWKFIGLLEGRKLTGYVPDAAHSKSGVTVATGCDIGAMTQVTFASLPADVASLVRPYLGLHSGAAVAALHARPLLLTDAQADALDAKTFGMTVAAAQSAFDHVRGAGAWAALPSQAQTVIASCCFQYGNPWVRCPHFWGAATAENWTALYADLKHFGDAYQTRHDQEAAHLAPLLTKG